MEKSAALTEYENKLYRLKAKELEKERRYRKLVDESHPIVSKAKLSPIKRKLQHWGARQNAYAADVPPKEIYKLLNPFAGLGSKGQESLDRLMSKQGAWTEHGKKMEKHKAKRYYNLSRGMHRINKEEPEMAAALFSYLAPWSQELVARKNAYNSQLEGAEKLKQLVPLLGMGRAGKEDLKQILNKNSEKTAEYKELSQDSPTESYKGPLAALVGSTALSWGSGAALGLDVKEDMKSMNIEKADKLDRETKDIIKHFKGRGVNVEDIDLDEHPLKSRYNLFSGKLHSSRYTPDIVAHELGHADNARKFQNTFGRTGGKVVQTAGLPLQNVFAGGKDLGPIGRTPAAGLAVLPLMSDSVTDKLKSDQKGTNRNKAVDFIQDHPEAVAAGAMSPLLIEEGRATKKALDAVKETNPENYAKASRRLGKAYGTYAGFASLPVAAAYLYGKQKKHQKENNE